MEKTHVACFMPIEQQLLMEADEDVKHNNNEQNNVNIWTKLGYGQWWPGVEQGLLNPEGSEAG